MRKPEEIRADIEKLTKELEAVKIHESRQVAAVNILYNLGWTHDPHKGWQKPAPKWSDYKAPLKAGELATWRMVPLVVPCISVVLATSSHRCLTSVVLVALVLTSSQAASQLRTVS